MLSFSRNPLRIAVVVAIFAQSAAAAATPQMIPFRTITLKDAQSIAEAISVNLAIDAMMSAASSCGAHGLEAALKCACNSTADLQRLQASYRSAAAKHPDWNKPNTIVAYRNPSNGHFISLNFAATKAMIARCATR